MKAWSLNIRSCHWEAARSWGLCPAWWVKSQTSSYLNGWLKDGELWEVGSDWRTFVLGVGFWRVYPVSSLFTLLPGSHEGSRFSPRHSPAWCSSSSLANPPRICTFHEGTSVEDGMGGSWGRPPVSRYLGWLRKMGPQDLKKYIQNI